MSEETVIQSELLSFFFYIVNVAVVVDGVIADAYIVLLLMLM